MNKLYRYGTLKRFFGTRVITLLLCLFLILFESLSLTSCKKFSPGKKRDQTAQNDGESAKKDTSIPKEGGEDLGYGLTFTISDTDSSDQVTAYIVNHKNETKFVQVQETPSSSALTFAEKPASHTFRIYGLPAGDYDVIINAGRKGRRLNHVTFYQDRNNDMGLVTLPPLVTVKGKVELSFGRVGAGILVTFPGTDIPPVWTDTSGEYTIPDVPVGSHEVAFIDQEDRIQVVNNIVIPEPSLSEIVSETPRVWTAPPASLDFPGQPGNTTGASTGNGEPSTTASTPPSTPSDSNIQAPPVQTQAADSPEAAAGSPSSSTVTVLDTVVVDGTTSSPVAYANVKVTDFCSEAGVGIDHYFTTNTGGRVTAELPQVTGNGQNCYGVDVRKYGYQISSFLIGGSSQCDAMPCSSKNIQLVRRGIFDFLSDNGNQRYWVYPKCFHDGDTQEYYMEGFYFYTAPMPPDGVPVLMMGHQKYRNMTKYVCEYYDSDFLAHNRKFEENQRSYLIQINYSQEISGSAPADIQISTSGVYDRTLYTTFEADYTNGRLYVGEDLLDWNLASPSTADNRSMTSSKNYYLLPIGPIPEPPIPVNPPSSGGSPKGTGSSPGSPGNGAGSPGSSPDVPIH
ncbi:MAG: hypothetical protein HQK54_07995 [Oligoflexales bacterium]|nr:hypothetical protein [Oligoflexales bacterium]